MFWKLIVALLISLSVTPLVAVASQPYVNIEQRLTAEQLRATGLDKLSAEQLKLLNQLLGEESAKLAKAEKLSPPAPAPGEPGHGSLMGLDDKPIKGRLKGTVIEWEPGTVFELDNGQQWKVLKGSMKLRKPLQSPEIVLVPGLAGRWFLQVDEDLPKARVYRID